MAEIERRLAFVDLQLDAGFMRLGISAEGGSDPIVLLVSARAEPDTADE